MSLETILTREISDKGKLGMILASHMDYSRDREGSLSGSKLGDLLDDLMTWKAFKDVPKTAWVSKNPKWCMCTELNIVAKDFDVTCGNCGGKDAYGMSEERPPEFFKECIK